MSARDLGRRPLPVLLAALLSGAAVVAAAVALLPGLAGALAGWSPAALECLFAALLYGTLAAVGWAGLRLAGVGAGPGAAPRGQALAAGMLVGAGGYLLALLLARTAGSVAPGGPALSAGALALAAGTLSVLGQSAAEELFFRGWLQRVLVRGWGPAAGVAASALAFAALHVAGGARGGLQLANLALGGALFGLLALRSGTLWAPVAAHGAWNWSEIVLWGLDPNPGVGSFGAVSDLDLAGSAWWGGSAEGMNGSAAMGVVLVALVLPLLWGRAGWPFTRTAAPG